MRPQNHSNRRGAAIVAIILVMLLIGLIIVGAVLGGARDQDMTKQRVQTLRSMYAAESGINMAVREMVLNTDSDGDGGIGTISDDGNSANNPSLDSATWYVTSSTSGAVTTLTSHSSLGSTRRSVDADMTGSLAAGGPSGLVAYWKMDDGSGTTVNDSYSSHDGTATSTTWATGPWGGAMKYNGVGSSVDIPNDSAFQVTSAFTACGWVKCTAGSSFPMVDTVVPIVRKGENNPNNWQVSICNAKVNILMDDNDNAGISGDTTLSAGRWYHVAGTWDGSYGRLYVNGVLDHSPPVARSGSIGTDTRDVHVGGRPTTDSFDGRLDDVRFYNRALSQAEIREVMNGTRHMIYGDASTNIPKIRDWDSNSWDTEASALDVGASPRWVVARNSAVLHKTIAAVGDSVPNLNVMVYDGANWSDLLEVASSLGTSTERAFDVTVEQLTGKVMVAFRNASTANIYYRRWTGSAWTSSASTSISGSGSPKFVKMAAKPESNEITLVVLDSNNDVSAMTWNGSSWGNKILLDSSGAFNTTECIDLSYETISGRSIVCWSRNGTTIPQYCIWSGSAWGSVTAMTDVGGNTKWMRVVSDPISNKMIAMTLDSNSDVNVQVWDGSSIWSAVSEFETGSSDNDRRDCDVAFEPAGTRALIMYSHSATTTPYYRTYDGTNWSGQLTGPNITNVASVVQMTPAKGGKEIMIGIERKTDGALCFMRWDGSAMQDNQVIESDLGGSTGNECFMMTESLEGLPAMPSVSSWAEVSP